VDGEQRHAEAQRVMWAASAMSASESASVPPTISTTMTVSVIDRATRSRPRYAAAAVPVGGAPCACP
jgi:hypothetical protein